MALIIGAAKFLNAATLANTRGVAPSTPNVLGENASVASVLDGARNTLAVPGIGLSSRSRALTAAFLNRTDDINKMFSLGLGSGATIEGLQQQILALRAKLPLTELGASVLNVDVDGVGAGSTGGNVDTEA